MEVPTLTPEDILRRTQRAKEEDRYWQATRPSCYLVLNMAGQYVRKMGYGMGHENDPFVYFPDFRVAGFASDIVAFFHKAGITTLDDICDLHRTENGRLGGDCGSIPIDVDHIINNSFNPLNPIQAEYIERLSYEVIHNRPPVM